MREMEEVNQSLTELWDAATALHDLIEKATSMLPAENARAIIAAIEANTSIIEAIEARWGKDVWERHRASRRGVTEPPRAATGKSTGGTLVEGDAVRVIAGPFASFYGVVEDVDEVHSRVKVAVTVFGRVTPVELDFDQVEKF